MENGRHSSSSGYIRMDIFYISILVFGDAWYLVSQRSVVICRICCICCCVFRADCLLYQVEEENTGDVNTRICGHSRYCRSNHITGDDTRKATMKTSISVFGWCFTARIYSIFLFLRARSYQDWFDIYPRIQSSRKES